MRTERMYPGRSAPSATTGSVSRGSTGPSGSFGEVPRPERGTTANAIKAVDYLTDLKTRHNLNIVATNNSWGGGGYSQALHDAIIRGAKAGILFIPAAGNSDHNNDTKNSYPSNYNTAIGTATESAAG